MGYYTAFVTGNTRKECREKAKRHAVGAERFIGYEPNLSRFYWELTLSVAIGGLLDMRFLKEWKLRFHVDK